MIFLYNIEILFIFMKRNERLAHEVGKQVAIAISSVFSIEESGVFTVRHVEVLADFSEARIWISRIAGDSDFFSRLNHAKNKIAIQVFSKIKIVKTPKLVFIEDFSGEIAQRMEKIFKGDIL